MKIGLLVGLVLAGGIMVYVCTRPSLSPMARILRQNRQGHQQARPEVYQPQPAVGESTTAASLTDKLEQESPGAGEDSASAQLPPENQGQTGGRVTAGPQQQPVEDAPAEKRYIDKDYKTRKFYIVRQGDTLSKISKKYYGSANKWYRIYEANRDMLNSPDRLKPGMKLHIPD